jgi:hypothetical protein
VISASGPENQVLAPGFRQAMPHDKLNSASSYGFFYKTPFPARFPGANTGINFLIPF